MHVTSLNKGVTNLGGFLAPESTVLIEFSTSLLNPFQSPVENPCSHLHMFLILQETFLGYESHEG